MNKRNGFTLIELMIVIAIIGILVSLVVPIMRGGTGSTTQQVQHTQCIEGVKFTLDKQPKQIIGPNGAGISCDTVTENSYSTESTWYD